ncbi:GPO family capsid scaffolding protein [Endozoicomonas lisbonensis]|uniref:Phage capsid protein n=1 Tax=Endozoicomonas lisbonensis TaxID=3120522 RepID=A0ABV2SGX8_9GAMM
MSKLITDWVKVAESGHTIDGRTIEKSWLQNAAELYSKNTYTAIITLEHYSPEWAGNYGTVEALEARDEDNSEVGLYAKLCPNDQLIRINRSGQKLFTSLRFRENFRQTGKMYVIQIGVTDTPASIGTEQLSFRVTDGDRVEPGVELTSLLPESSDDSEAFTPAEQSYFKKFIKALAFSAPQSTPQSTDSEDEGHDMKPEELTAAIAKGINEAFAAREEKQPAPDATPDDDKDTPDTPEMVSAEVFNTLKTEHDALKTEFSSFKEEMSKELPGTDIDNAGGQDDAPAEKIGF